MPLRHPPTLDPIPELARRHAAPALRRHGLCASMVCGALLILGSLLMADAQAHVNRCITLKGTSLSDLTQVLDSRDRLGWECLRIIENSSLTRLDLSRLNRLTYLKIEGNPP